MFTQNKFSVILLLSLLYLIAESTEKVRYDNYHLYKLKLNQDSEHHKTIKQEIKNHGIIDLHGDSANEIHLLIPPNKVPKINSLLKKHRVARSVLVSISRKF